MKKEESQKEKKNKCSFQYQAHPKHQQMIWNHAMWDFIKSTQMISTQNAEILPSLVLKVSNVFDNFLLYLNPILLMSWINFIFHHICAVTDSTESTIESVSLNIAQANVLGEGDALENVEPALFQSNESMRSISEDIETVTRAKKRSRGNVNDVNDLIENDILLDESDSESQNKIDWNDIAWEKAVGKRMDCDDLIYTKDEKHLYGKNKVLKNGDIAYLELKLK